MPARRGPLSACSAALSFLAAGCTIVALSAPAGATPSSAATGTQSAGATPTASTFAAPTPSPSAAHRSASATAGRTATGSKTPEKSSSEPTSSEPTSHEPSCPATVHITIGTISSDGTQVTIALEHTGPECASAQPATLHVHQNLLRTPTAGSDPEHQSNNDIAVGTGFGDSVTLPLLAGVVGKCFVQVDVHASGVARGRFFPTADCPQVESSSTSVPPPPSTSSVPPTPTTSPVSQGVEATAITQPAPASTTAVAALASTGSYLLGPVLLAVLAIGFGLLMATGMGSPKRRR
ncbi:MAG: hypothetical protein QOE89_1383 [Pseudonocardiales bacterium]|nr:hypothetical protein [Pseudonocardiales bacterium]